MATEKLVMGMVRKPRKIACPACHRHAEAQPIVEEGIRVKQAFICDTPTCPVSSFVVEWRDGAR